MVKKTVFQIIILCLLPFFLAAQSIGNFWREVSEDQLWLQERSVPESKPRAFRTMQLDYDALRQFLQNAPPEGSPSARKGQYQLSLPMPDGELEIFSVWNSPVMEPELARKYPEIQTFAGRGISNPNHTLRLDYGPNGFHAAVLSPNGGSVIVPYASHQTKYYLCYSNADHQIETLNYEPSARACGYTGEMVDNHPDEERTPVQLRSNTTELRKYRFALACTGEFGAARGSKLAAFGAIVTSTNTLNSILERDAGIRLILIANNDLIVFTDPNTDPYNNANLGGGLLRQNEDALNNIIGLSNYDIGHVFTTGCSDVGGVVSGTTCSSGKGRGVTCHSNSNVVGVTLNITVHEVGHQFSAGHTFNNCPGSEGQMASGSAFEPGSGSTFLSYQRSCGESNIPGAANLHYHGGTLEEIWRYSKLTGGNVCPVVEKTSNHAPLVNLPYKDGFYIPINTPFELRATATDADNDPLTYCWEQLNLGPSVALGSPAGNSPLFRSYDPIQSGTRTFPRLETILKNTSDITEVLPSYGRNIKFRVTVRDNNVLEGAAGLSWKDVSFEATASAGPFVVSIPDSSNVVWKSGHRVKVNWDVANTDKHPVNCQAVNIRLSTDGGLTYPHLLIGATPNDGEEFVFVPDLSTNKARVKVEAADNIFFDISNADFSIVSGTIPTYTLSLGPQQQQTCLPNHATVEIRTSPVLNFNTPIQLSIVEGLPSGVSISFSKNPVAPGQSSSIIFDMTKVRENGSFQPVLRTIAGSDTVFHQLYFNIVYSDFTMLRLTEPADGKSGFGILPVFKWTKLAHADNYEFQLSTSPSFAAAEIISEASDIAQDTFVPTVALKESTIYYWRIRPANECGKAEWSLTHTFQTRTVTCNQFVSSDVPKFISSVGLPVVQSILTILDNSIISDLNVIDLKGTHDALPHLSVSLKSPKGTEVELFSNICGNVSSFHLGLDDESPFAIACPPLNGLKYKPHKPLSAFIDESTFGNWTLTVKVIHTDGQGGNLEKWSLEFCGPVTPKNPYIVARDTLRVPPNGTGVLQDTHIHVKDDDDSPFQLKFTIVNPTLHGTLMLNNQPLKVGGQFTMADITAGKISYTNTNAAATFDFFTFIVEDGGGGWLGTPILPINIDPQTSGSEVLREEKLPIKLFPNPVADILTLELQHPVSRARLSICDIYGREVLGYSIRNYDLLNSLEISSLPGGVYTLYLYADGNRSASKFIVIR